MSDTSLEESPRLAAAVAGGAPLLFLSAHLDDAVFSCGALISALAGSCPITVATVFTEAGPPPHTYAARSFLAQCRADDVGVLYRERRAEDRAVLAGLGVAGLHLGHADALFRGRDVPGPVGRLGRLLPELVHRYPTYRWDIARGRVSRGDRRLLAGLVERTGALLAEIGSPLLFCPVGVGRHVDHLITRAVGAAHPDRVVYYSDHPYDLAAAPDPGFLTRHRLRSWSWPHGITAKIRHSRGYRTQYDAVFGEHGTGERPETYYEPDQPATRRA